MPYECEKEITLKSVLRNVRKECKNVAIIIGPEGGFTEEEVKLLSLEKVKRVTLGPRILRTETAGLATLSVVLYELRSLSFCKEGKKNELYTKRKINR